MNDCSTILNHLKTASSAQIADRQQLEEMDNFETQASNKILGFDGQPGLVQNHDEVLGIGRPQRQIYLC
jgi:hypothetical protein